MTNIEINKLPTILNILEKIAAEEETLRNDEDWNFLHQTQGLEPKFEIVSETPLGPCVLMPTSTTINSFFRGQTDNYEPCFPTIYRKKKEKDRDAIDCFISRLRTIEFELLICKHPFVCRVFNEGLIIKNCGEDVLIKLKVDYLGLAQHYELETEMFDFTNDKWVAAFFATCKKNGDIYKPFESNGYGVFYWYCPPLEDIIIEVDNVEKKFTAIGLQPFKRPGEQKAFALKMEERENLNVVKGMQKYFFRHDKLASEIIFNRLNQGEAIFPKDEIEKMASIIKTNRKISIDAFELAFQRYPVKNMKKVDMHTACIQKGIKFVNYQVMHFPKGMHEKFVKDWENGGEKDFLSKIVYREVYTGA